MGLLKMPDPSKSAAVIPHQFGVPTGAALGPYAGGISGTIGQTKFSAGTDVIGGNSSIPGQCAHGAPESFPARLDWAFPRIPIVHEKAFVLSSIA
jgi:hypothetical protein